MKVLRLYTSEGSYYSDGAHPDKIALMLKNLERIGATWNRMELVDMPPEMYTEIPATQSAARLFEPNANE